MVARNRFACSFIGSVLCIGMILLVATVCAEDNSVSTLNKAESQKANLHPAAHPNLHSVMWMQSSAEYAACTLQAYAAATTYLDRAVKEKDWTAVLEQEGDYQNLPPAIILDIDETVLDNSPFQARLIRVGLDFDSKMWRAWCSEASAAAIPGSLEFLRLAKSQGIKIFYVTNRDSKLENDTRRNLERAGFPVDTDIDTVLMKREKPEWSTSDKGSRRQFIARSYRIIMMFGDNLGDFLSGVFVSPADRMQKVQQSRSYWGMKWFVIPNPAYGSWLESTTQFDRSLSDSQRMKMRVESLKTAD